MKKEMIEVIFYENDATSEVNDIDGNYKTQEMCGYRNGELIRKYHCEKSRWKKYLLKLLNSSIKGLTSDIRMLDKKKKRIEKLKEQIEREA